METTDTIKTLKSKILITVAFLILARIGVFIPIPGLDHTSFYQSMKQNGIINFLNIFSGGGFSTLGLFTLGISPYINASIVMQSLNKVLPSLKELQEEEGAKGRQKITQITRYVALGWSVLQSIAIAFWIKPYVFNWDLKFIIETTIALTTGSIIVMWIGESISEKGIGNGASLIICLNIAAGMGKNLDLSLSTGQSLIDISKLTIIFLTFISMAGLIILVQSATRKIELISIRQLGKGINKNSYLPLNFKYLGVMPLILASTGINLIQIQLFNKIFANQPIFYFLYYISYYILIILFSFFQSSIVLDPLDISKNLKKMETNIPGIKPGKPTQAYLENIINRLTFLGANLLFCTATLPSIISAITTTPELKGLGVTTLFILVSVTIDTGKQINTYFFSDSYKKLM
uniref:preprotein translocase subunit SecY n=1 Tax=Madagascaria erythrocladioides TaxID=753684 RepID=UPI001BEF3ED2|nr:preprotein translocase subunit SecY [Madagascaria erythrocladioides]QUE29033.1 SecY [Madagascaria erythrocladioides]UNJ16587.1 preprotein translocase subunit SecY [Madagascaria erythrocladioides]